MRPPDYCAPKKRQKLSASPVTPCDRGPTKGLYNTSLLQVDSGATMLPACTDPVCPSIELQTSSIKKRKRRPTKKDAVKTKKPKHNKKPKHSKKPKEGPSTVVCRPRSKKTTSRAKSKSCKPSTQTTKPTPTLPPGSITDEGASRGFWNTSKAAWSQRLWWPIATDSHALDANSSNGSSDALAPGSSFKIKVTRKNQYPRTKNSPKTYWPWSTCSLAASTDEEDTKKLTKSEQLRRGKVYKGLTKDQHKAKKAEFDAAQVPMKQRMRLVRMFPTPRQHQYLMRWFRDTRKTYNRAMHYVIKHGLHKQHKSERDTLVNIQKTLQSRFVARNGVEDMSLSQRYRAILNTPKIPRQQAVKSVISVLKAHDTRVQKSELYQQENPTKKPRPVNFNPGFKSRKMTGHDSISLERNYLRIENDSTVCFYPRFKSHKDARKAPGIFTNVKVQYGMSSLPKLEQDFKIHYRYGKFYLLLPERRSIGYRLHQRRTPSDKIKPTRIAAAQQCSDFTTKDVPKQESIVALDPGVRTFLTGYSPEGSVVEVCHKAQYTLDKLIRRIERRKMICKHVKQTYKNRKSEIKGALGRKKRRKLRGCMRRVLRRYHEAEDKAKRVIRDMHYKAAHFLLARYKTIILPKTSSHHWRQGKRLHKTTKKRAMLISLGNFSRRLVQTATDYPTCKVVRCSEAYTSKQCGACGTINDKLGSSKLFKCHACGAVADRDVHGARNILLRALD